MSKKVIEEDLSITSKGTLTLPVQIRRLLGVPKAGGKLKVRFFLDTNEAVIYKPKEFLELQEMTHKYLRSDRQPLTNVNEFYQKRKTKDLKDKE